RSGVSGDLIVAAPPSDGFGLATGLWDWSWGLPVSAFVSARLSQTARAGGFAAFGGAGELAGFGFDAEGEELLGRFARDYPLGSLVVLADADPETAARESAALLEAGGPALDRGSSFALAASRRALEAGYSGHARIVVPRFADPAWDGEGAGAPSAGARLVRPDAVIAPTMAGLESALRGLL
ncbi:MAG: hypothetical protein JNG85_05725, partial [Spirochaetaceae bacterium]|nr:hypothetical protein [Spirochaetaceae bacterium]